MKTIGKIIFLIGISLMLAAPMVCIHTEETYVSPMDNRVMTFFPEHWWENLSVVEDYVNDRIGFRNEWVTADQYIDFYLYNELNHPLYQMGKEGQVYTREWDPVTYQHLDVTGGFPESMAEFLLFLQNDCNVQGIDFCFLLAPSKESIYGEYYPAGYGIKDQPNRSDLIMEALDEKGVYHIDTRISIGTQKDVRPVYNQKYDAGHWSAYGMFVGVQQLYEDFLVSNHPEVEMLSLSEFTISTEIEPYLPNSFFVINDEVETLEPVDDTATLALDNGVGELYSRQWKNETIKDAPKILIFGDSYFGHVDTYFKNHFSEVTLLHINNMWDFKGCVERLEPDIVVVEACEWVLDTHRYSMFDWKSDVFELYYQ